MKTKIISALLTVQALLLLLYFMDGNWYNTNSLKTELGKFQDSGHLSEQSVHVFAQDKSLHMWIGTSNGLNIYFGNEYKQLFYDPSDSTTIPDNNILSILRDSKGQMWVGTKNGVAKHTGGFKFKRYDIPFSPDGVYQISDYSDGVLVNNGIDVYIIRGEKISPFYHFSSFSETSNLIFPDCEGGFWTLQPTVVRHYNKESRETMPPVLCNKANMGCAYKHGDTVWYNQSHKLSAIDLRHNKIVFTTKEKLPIIPTSIYQKNKNTIFLNSTFHGLYSLNTKTCKLTKLTDGDFHLRHKDVTISTMFGDAENNLWIGYQYGGFQVISPNTIIYESFNNTPLNILTRNKQVTCIDAIGDNIVGSTEDEVFYYNLNKKTFTNYLYKEIFSDSPFFRQTLEDVVPYKNHYAWLITNVRILSCELKNGKINVLKRVFSRKNTGPLLGTGIRIGNDVLVNSNSQYLIRCRFRSDVCDSIHMDSNLYGKESLLQQLPDGRVLIVMKGLDMALYNPLNGKVEHISVQKPVKVKNTDPSVVFMDSKNRVWIGTRHNGLWRFNYENLMLTDVDYVPLGDIRSIQEDRKGVLWICSHDDLLSLNVKDSTVRFSPFPSSYNSNGRNIHYMNSCNIRSENCMVLGTSHGCLTFPLEFSRNATPSSLKIHSLQINSGNGRVIGVNSQFKDNKHFTFPHDENNITIDFSSINYGNRERMMYQYKLEGFDKQWSVPTLQQRAKYQHIPPGTYRFRVRVIASQSQEALSECGLQLTIKPSLWMSYATFYFYFVCLALTIYYVQLQFLKNQKDKLKIEQLTAERIREKRNREMIINFFANISHEFRNPLTLISGPLLMLKGDKTLTGSAHKTLNIVCASVDRMLMLIDQILDFNKLETDALRLQIAKCDAAQRMSELITLFAESARLRGIRVVLTKPDNNMYLWMDCDKFDKIMSNLLTNALKNTPDNGVIKVFMGLTSSQDRTDFQMLKASEGGRFLKVCVYNSGKHIDEKKIPNIFKRYYQVEGTQATHQYGWGTGLGLYYVKRLLKLHHGDIYVKNEDEGGVSFVFTFPISASDYNDEDRTTNKNAQRQISVDTIGDEAGKKLENNINAVNETAHKPIILIVDDDIAVAQYIRSLFINDYIVVNKYSAEAALSEINDIRPDIVLSDVIMGDMNGYEFCRKLKSELMTCHIPVVLITAKSNVNEQIEGLEEGANAYVTKPFEPRYLKAVVVSQLNNMRILRLKLSEGNIYESITENLSKQDRNFLDLLYASMEKHVSEQDMSINTISQELLISHSKLNYKLKELTGETPGSFFRKYKLNTAARLLREGKYNVSEVAYLTGFGTASHFSVAFKKQFGVSPSEYQ